MSTRREVPDEPLSPYFPAWVWRRIRATRFAVWRGRAGVLRAGRQIEARRDLDTVTVRLDARQRSIVWVRATALDLAAAGVPQPRPARFIARGLLTVHAGSFTVLWADVLAGRGGTVPLDRVPAGAVLALCVVAAQVLLALDVGRRLRPGAHVWPPPGPPVPALLGAGLLAVLGSVTLALAVGWAEARQPDGVGTLAGAVLGLAALAGPLVLVADEVYGPGPDGRRLARAERILTRWERRARRTERRARRALHSAERALLRATSAHDAVDDALGPDHRVTRGLAEAVAALRGAIRTAWCDYDAAVDPIAPEDLDLAG